MGTELTNVNPKLPAIFQGAAKEAYQEYTEGVTAGFPVISYRGRTWRVKKGGEEQVYLNEDQEAVQSIEIIMIRSHPELAKIYYKKDYEEGDTSQPDCWSADGRKPDSGVLDPVSKACGPCPMNVWGSKITKQGKKTRACSDVRRMAVAFKHEVEQKALDPDLEVTVLLLRVPPASLNPLKDYIEKTLQPKGIPPYALATRVGFDTDVSYPKLTFKGVQFLNEEQGQVVVELRESDEVKRILSEAAEYSSEGTTASDEGEDAGAPAEPEVAAAPSESTPSPAAEEELHTGEDDIAPAATPTEPPDDEIAPPEESAAAKKKAAAAKKAAAKKAAAKKAKAAEPVTEPAPTADTAAGEVSEDFDAMLDSLLD